MLSYFATEIDGEMNTKLSLLSVTVNEETSSFKIESHSELSIESGKNVEKVFSLGNTLVILVDRVCLEKLNTETQEFEIWNDLELEENENVKSLKVLSDMKVVYLTDKDNLYVNNKKVSGDCTSFEVASGYLFFTVASQTVYDLLHAHSINGGSKNVRNLEKGSSDCCCFRDSSDTKAAERKF